MVLVEALVDMLSRIGPVLTGDSEGHATHRRSQTPRLHLTRLFAYFYRVAELS
jgi:hypothetical protein